MKQDGNSMERFTDIHSHILFGVDDGARDLEMSIRMLRMADENGIGSIILTPHNKPMHHNITPAKAAAAVGRLQEEILKAGLDIALYTGNELYYHSGILEKLEHAASGTLAGSSYVLVEFGPMDEFDYIRNGIYQIMTGGYRPVLAHVERYLSVISEMEHVEDLSSMGCYIQVNADSIMGKAGHQAKRFTRQLLKRRLVQFVATDAHSDGTRGPYLAECAAYLCKKHGEDYMRQLLIENPSAIIADRYI